MYVVDSYPIAVALCALTMLCWGSWANTQKLAKQTWSFQLFYWDYSIGVLLLALLLAFTLGSNGQSGRAFLVDIAQADQKWLLSAFIGGVIFNLSNILLVAAVDIAGLAVAFPIGVGLALVLGVVTTYQATHTGNAVLLAAGVGCVLVAILLDAIAYKRMASAARQFPIKGIVLSIVAGVLMGFFFSFVAQSMGDIDAVSQQITPGKLSPYTALVVFSAGLFLSSFVWNSIVMAKPFSGEPVTYGDYFAKGNDATRNSASHRNCDCKIG